MRDADDTISKLLRLKRHELPPPDYFEKLLEEFHQRQRVELLRRPAWRIALDRLEAFMGQFTLSHFSYATASLAVLAVAGSVTFNMLQHPGGLPTAGTLATNTRPMAAMDSAQPLRLVAAQPAYAPHEFTLDPQISFPDTFQTRAVQQGATRLHPRYILDTRPASYEPPFSF